MLITVFRHWLNLIGASIPTLRLAMDPTCTPAKRWRPISPPRCGARSHFIAKQSVRTIGTMYPLPPHKKMTLRYAHSLVLLAAVLLLAVAPPVTAQTIDYDTNDNGLIEVSNIAQLNAMRYDPNGNGDATHQNYVSAFTNRDTAAATRMGCPSGTCTGYELMADLAFSDTTSSIYNPFWPIGNATDPFGTVFDGNDHTIDSLTTPPPNAHGNMGLFGVLGGSGRIRNLGVKNPTVYSNANQYAGGGLVGIIRENGVVSACYVSRGSVRVNGVNNRVGGLAGINYGIIRASYSTATVGPTNTALTSDYGGLLGRLENNGAIIASYAAGPVSSRSLASDKIGGLIGRRTASGANTARSTNSYCDTQITTQSNGIGEDQASPLLTVPGYTTAQLQNPIGYTGIYANWNIDLDGDSNVDFPWNFGTSSAYPTLNTPAQRTAATPSPTDYDANDNNFIDISTLAQLNAIRWDLDGDGDPATANFNAYSTAFGGRTAGASGRMGCPGTCMGYELMTDLTLSSWTPTGGWDTTFDGNGHTLTGATITATGASDAGFLGFLDTNAVVRDLGLVNFTVTASTTHAQSKAS